MLGSRRAHTDKRAWLRPPSGPGGSRLPYSFCRTFIRLVPYAGWSWFPYETPTHNFNVTAPGWGQGGSTAACAEVSPGKWRMGAHREATIWHQLETMTVDTGTGMQGFLRMACHLPCSTPKLHNGKPGLRHHLVVLRLLL